MVVEENGEPFRCIQHRDGGGYVGKVEFKPKETEKHRAQIYINCEVESLWFSFRNTLLHVAFTR